MGNNARLDEIIYMGNDAFDEGKPLAEIFEHEIDNERMAWYVDYYTEDPERFRVRYLAKNDNGTVMMTNENKEDRDPADPDSSQWGESDVAEWFTRDGCDIEHRWVFLFQHPSGEMFGIHVEGYRVFAFGPSPLSLSISNVWGEYVEHGIRGPLRAAVGGTEVRLHAIVADPDVAGELTKAGLLVDYMSALAALLDG